MAKPYDDDLRRKFLAALDRGEGTITELSGRFGVSVAWGWKISAARNRSGHASGYGTDRAASGWLERRLSLRC